MQSESFRMWNNLLIKLDINFYFISIIIAYVFFLPTGTSRIRPEQNTSHYSLARFLITAVKMFLFTPRLCYMWVTDSNCYEISQGQ